MLRYLRNVVTLKLDVEACIGCGMCSIVCPHAVFRMTERHTTIHDRDACMECGACARNCPVDALEVRSGVGCATGIMAGLLRGGDACCGEDTGCCAKGG